MGATVLITSQAWRDLTGIIRYIGRDNPPAADRFADRLLVAAQSLGKTPLIGCRIKGFDGVRMTVHGRYFILYQFEVGQNRVLVLRFWHSARDLKRLNLHL